MHVPQARGHLNCCCLLLLLLLQQPPPTVESSADTAIAIVITAGNMLPAFARRPLTQSPRLRFLAVRPGCRVPHRFSSTEADVAPSSDGKAAVTADASAEPDYPEKHFSKANNKPVFSDGSDFALLSKEYAIMTKKHGWTLDSQKRGIRKIYQFSSYTKCLVRMFLSFFSFLSPGSSAKASCRTSST